MLCYYPHFFCCRAHINIPEFLYPVLVHIYTIFIRNTIKTRALMETLIPPIDFWMFHYKHKYQVLHHFYLAPCLLINYSSYSLL